MSSSVNSNQNPVCESRDDINHFNSNKPMIEVFLNGQPVSFELDTGAALTCMSKVKFSQLNLSNCKVINSVKTLCVANGQTVNVSMIARCDKMANEDGNFSSDQGCSQNFSWVVPDSELFPIQPGRPQY